MPKNPAIELFFFLNQGQLDCHLHSFENIVTVCPSLNILYCVLFDLVIHFYLPFVITDLLVALCCSAFEDLDFESSLKPLSNRI